MLDVRSLLLVIVILVVGIILLYSAMARAAHALERIAKAIEKEDGDDDGGKSLAILITGHKNIAGTKNDKVVNISEYRRSAEDPQHLHEHGYGHGV